MLRTYKVPSSLLFPVDVVPFLGAPPTKSNCAPNKKVAMLALVSGLFVEQVGVRLATGRKEAKAATYRGASPVRAGKRAGGFTLPNPFTEPE